jgi:LmbE family N-acetylglucosaminyl deacetylase/AmiR/NasT family two-component response regulator
MLDAPPTVLLVEDDPDVAAYTATVLRTLAGARVVDAASADGALTALDAHDLDLVVTDIELLGRDGAAPGADGLALTATIRQSRPLLPVVVLSGHATFHHAVVAMRAGASEFLPKPVDPTRLATVATALVEQHRQRVAAAAVSVLAISAHPDDAEIGIGATLARHTRHGHAVTMLTLSGGEVGGTPGARAAELAEAAAVLGARLEHRSLPDTGIAEGPPTVPLIEEVVAQVRPTVVYLHSAEDTHQDHRAVHRAGLVAVRGVPTVLCYQSPSATVTYRPGRFSDVTGFLDVKLTALACHRSQSHAWYMDPELVTATARFWGRYGRIRHAEPLEVVRDVPRPDPAPERHAQVNGLTRIP